MWPWTGKVWVTGLVTAHWEKLNESMICATVTIWIAGKSGWGVSSFWYDTLPHVWLCQGWPHISRDIGLSWNWQILVQYFQVYKTEPGDSLELNSTTKDIGSIYSKCLSPENKNVLCWCYKEPMLCSGRTTEV